MPKYTVTFSEKIYYQVVVNSSSQEEAIENAKELHERGRSFIKGNEDISLESVESDQ